MVSSNTYSYAPSIADTILNGFARIQLRPSELTTEHLNDAATEANLLMVSVSNRQPNSYTITTPTIPLIQGVSTYNLPNQTLLISIVYLTTGTSPNTVDRPLGPISSSEYAAISNKTVQGAPTCYWFSLTTPTPTITVWPVPDGGGPYLANVQCFSQQQDASLRNGQTWNAPYRLLDALSAGMAYRLSRIYKPDLTQMRKQEWEEAWSEFAQIDESSVQINVIPGLSGYFL